MAKKIIELESSFNVTNSQITDIGERIDSVNKSLPKSEKLDVCALVIKSDLPKNTDKIFIDGIATGENTLYIFVTNKNLLHRISVVGTGKYKKYRKTMKVKCKLKDGILVWSLI